MSRHTPHQLAFIETDRGFMCTDTQKEDIDTAIEEAEAAAQVDEGDATTAGLSVAAACALAVASLYHM